MDDETPSGDIAIAETAEPALRFPVEVPGFAGSLEQLVIRAQRGEIDLSQVPVSRITSDFRRLHASENKPDLRDTADFIGLVSRLVNLKAQAALPDPSATGGEESEDTTPVDDAGRRLAEYRLFKAAAEALLAEAAEEGARSFLGLVASEEVPVERLRIPPERLAAAFRAVLERLNEIEPLPVGTVTFSVEEMATRLRLRIGEAGSLRFEEIFDGVGSRLEAVALFLGLLELLRDGEVIVDQVESLGPITVRVHG